MNTESRKHKFDLEQAVRISSQSGIGLSGIAGIGIGIVKGITIKERTEISLKGAEEHRDVNYTILTNPFGNEYHYSEKELSALEKDRRLTWQAKAGQVILKDGKKYLVDKAKLGSVSTGCDPGLADTKEMHYSITARELGEDGIPKSQQVYFDQEEPYEVITDPK